MPPCIRAACDPLILVAWRADRIDTLTIAPDARARGQADVTLGSLLAGWCDVDVFMNAAGLVDGPRAARDAGLEVGAGRSTCMSMGSSASRGSSSHGWSSRGGDTSSTSGLLLGASPTEAARCTRGPTLRSIRSRRGSHGCARGACIHLAQVEVAGRSPSSAPRGRVVWAEASRS